jgi:hypothetical protein
MLNASRELGMDAWNDEDFVLSKVHFNWVKSYLARTLLMDLVSLLGCLYTLKKNYAFYKLAIQLIRKLPASVRMSEKINILRNSFKKVGIHEIVRQTMREPQLVFRDEGTLHSVHYLFVHLTTELPDADLENFARLVPQPDLAIYLCQDEQVLVERTLRRGHKRIPAGSKELVEKFIRRASFTFEKLVHHPAIEPRLIFVESDGQVITPGPAPTLPGYPLALQILQAGLETTKNGR